MALNLPSHTVITILLEIVTVGMTKMPASSAQVGAHFVIVHWLP